MRKNRFVKQKDSMHCGVACVRESSVTGSSTLKSEPMCLSPLPSVLAPGIYIIQIQGDGWYAEGEIEVE